ncbi:MAG: pallilysin-related adhesin [Treponema sp.]|jgi:hypothetical protein|nr:pallilysin-related adhesin [Treponema sp.]
MTGKFVKVTVLVVFLAAGLGIAALLVFPVSQAPENIVTNPQSRIIIPQSLDFFFEDNTVEQIVRIEEITLKASLGDGEILIVLLNVDLNGDLEDEQIVAYRNLLESDSPIYLTYIERDLTTGEYKRVWTARTAATRQDTISLYTQDLIGDRGICIIFTGMNNLGEQTLTVFRKNPYNGSPLFTKVAELKTEGSIKINAVERTQAYQLGMARGQSYTISAVSRDPDSDNIMDQLEATYNFNTQTEYYEQGRITRIPGAQIEQQRVRELLGSQRAFEEFITGLWYYVSPQGTLDLRQYIYFDPRNKEIIFFGDETQQAFLWQNSYSVRYGLSIRSQNIAISTMRRSIDIELESLDSIRVKIFDDINLKFDVSAPWDGSYRKASHPQNYATPLPSTIPFIDAVYDSHLGKLYFYPNGNFELHSGGSVKQGKYAFYYLDDQELLELRSYESRSAEIQLVAGTREVYAVESVDSEAPGLSPRKTILLSRVLLGARGIQKLYEGTITLNLGD